MRHELELILEEPNAALMLSRLDKLDLLKSIHPALHVDKSLRVRFESAKNTRLGLSNLEFSNSRISNIELSNIDFRDLRWLLWLMTLSSRESLL